MGRAFTKYSSNGNHFVLLDGMVGAPAPSTEEVVDLCDPVFGVGADGVAHISPGAAGSFRFRLWNADGSEAEMCGNAARASAWHFFRNHAPADAFHLVFTTMNGTYEALREGTFLWVKMTERKQDVSPDPALFKDFQRWHYVNTGVPHLVLQVPDAGKVDIEKEAPHWRHHAIFPRGTNVDYITVEDPSRPVVILRVFERGVEGETWSCGTGVAAVGWACKEFYGWDKAVTVMTRGGVHHVRWDEDGSLWYSGAIKLSFVGETP